MTVSATDAAFQPINLAPRARAVRGLKQWISDGRLAEGERLPSEQGLATALNVSRPTLRAALSVLEADGLVRPMSGRGRVVAATVRPNSSRSMMCDTIAIVSDMPSEKPRRGERVQGWESFIETGAQQLIGENGQHFMMLHPARLGEEGIASLMSDPPCGVIALRGVAQSRAGQSVIAKLRARQVPLVVYGDGPAVQTCDRIISDHRAGAYEVTKHLLSRGCRNILRYWAVAGSDARPAWLADRDAGYSQAMREAALPDGPMVEFWAMPSPASNKKEQMRAHFEANSRMAVGYLLPHVSGANPIDAVMVGSDGETFAVAAALRLIGKAPNRDVLIAGYDNYWSASFERQFEPVVPMVTVDKQNVTIGRELVNLLQERLSGNLPPEPQRRTVKPKLIVNDVTA